MANKKAFTLIELLAVILILGLLLLLVIPTVGRISESSKTNIRNNKIETIESGAAKYGNEAINNYQKCTSSTDSNELIRNNCIVDIPKLIELGYVEPDEESSVIDPKTNKPLRGKVLLCYDPQNVNIYASYVEDENYSCNAISVEGNASLNISPTGGAGYIGGETLTINLIKSGDFNANSFSCVSSNPGVTCSPNNRINPSSYTVTINPSAVTGTNTESTAELTISGETTKGERLKKIYNLKIYKTSLNVEAWEDNACVKTRTNKEFQIIGSNIGKLKISEARIIDGFIRDNTLSVGSSDDVGEGQIKITESNGNKSVTLNAKVYDLKLNNEIPNNLTLNYISDPINVKARGTGRITISTDNTNVISFIDSSGREQTSLVSEAENIVFKVKAKAIGTATITISGSTCGTITHTIGVSNMKIVKVDPNTLRETEVKEATLYLGGQYQTLTVHSQDTKINCASSDPNAVDCVVNGTSIVIVPKYYVPETKPIITVTTGIGEFGSVTVNLIQSSIKVVDGRGNEVTRVCQDINSSTSNTLRVTGENMGVISINEGTLAPHGLLPADYWYLGEFSADNEDKTITIKKRRLEEAQAHGWNTGYNKSAVVYNVSENNGNQNVNVYYNVYSFSVTPEKMVVGDIILEADKEFNFEVNSSATGAISVESSKSGVISSKVTQNNYNWSVNGENTATVTITGQSVGKTTIKIKGDECGYKEYNVTVIGSTYYSNLEKGSYVKKIESDKTSISCKTTGNNRDCETTFPTFEANSGFTVLGWSTSKDSMTADYQPGDTIKLDATSKFNTYYANVTDKNAPSCTFTEVPTNIDVGEVGYAYLTCKDSGIGFEEEGYLSESSFNISSPDVASITSVVLSSHTSNEHVYRVGITVQKKGIFNIFFEENQIYDKFYNNSKGCASSNITTSRGVPLEMWSIGKENREDIVAVIYSNSDAQGVDDGNYTLELYGSGEMLDFTISTLTGGGWETAPWYDKYHKNINHVVIDNEITNIGNYAFYMCEKLESIILPENISYIGSYAFYNTILKEVNIKESVLEIRSHAFDMSNSTLNKLTFAVNSNISNISEYAFKGHALTTLSIPDSLTSIGRQAFYQEYEVPRSELTLSFAPSSSLQTIEAEAFKNNKIKSLTIPISVETIEKNAFDQSNSKKSSGLLTTLVFEENSSLVTIDDEAFAGHKLSTLAIPYRTEKIGNSAFYQPSDFSLNRITFEEGSNLKTIGDTAFYGCTVSSLQLPESLESIGSYALGSRSNISTFTIGYNIKSLGDDFMSGANFSNIIVEEENQYFSSSDGVLYDKYFTTLIRVPDRYDLDHTELRIPLTVKNINEDSFGGWRTISDSYYYDVYLPSGLERLGEGNNFDYANIRSFNITNNDKYATQNGILFNKDLTILYKFPNSFNGSTYTVPSSVHTLYDRCGYGQANIVTLTIPESVRTIGTEALMNSTTKGFTKVYLNSPSDLDFAPKAFTIGHSSSNSTVVITRTITVADNILRDRLKSSYTDSAYSKYVIN